MDDLEEVIQEFLVEAGEDLDQLDRDFVELEKDPTSAPLLARVFRAVHTVKGSGGTLGFPKLSALAHAGESLLSRLRDGELLLTPETTSALLAMLDGLRAILSNIAEFRAEGDGDYSLVVARLSALMEPPAQRAAAAPSLNQAEIPLLGEILVDRLHVPEEQVNQALEQQVGGDPRKVGEILVDEGAVSAGTVVDALKTQAEALSEHVNSSIRVDVGLLDKLMNLVGELVLARNQVLQFNSALQQNAAFQGTAQRLNLITTELQEGVMKTRMQPIGTIWNKLPRIVRDLALGCGKAVEVEMHGAETELDRTIIEAIKGPMTHLIRNAIDHGIELPETRVAQGKPREGRLRLHAYHEGGQVNIEISDDGSGIAADRVKQKAIEKGLLTHESAARLSDRELLNLIFLPGLSTAKTVTNISGRGVGMDVVKTNIEKIGGGVDLQSAPGAGTTIKIKIPLTLAIIPALIVTSGGERFAIPQVSLLELIGIEGQDLKQKIELVHGAPVYRRRGHLLPLIYLNRELKLTGEGAEARDSANIIVLQAGERQFGLVADEINDTEEIVVKPLSKQLKGLSCFAGATIMGDGKVALILDVVGLSQLINMTADVRQVKSADEAAARDAHADNRFSNWLLFRAGADSRLAIPLALVSRLEEFAASRVEHSVGREVIQYGGSIMPLVHLSRLLGLPDAAAGETLQVIVYAVNGANIGIVVSEILDIVEQEIVIAPGSQSQWLLGTAVIQQRVTDLFNLGALQDSNVLEQEAVLA